MARLDIYFGDLVESAQQQYIKLCEAVGASTDIDPSDQIASVEMFKEDWENVTSE